MPRKRKTPAPAADAATTAPKRTRKRAQLLKGFKDVLPKDEQYWDHVNRVIGKAASQYGYGKIQTPVLEDAGLFVRTVGKGTDIVSKEMFRFIDQGGDDICLRPEETAPVVRAYIEHGMQNLPQPVKLYYHLPMFRRENPQAGRLRGFYQFGFEILGAGGPVVDAQMILIAHNICLDAGLKPGEVTVQINSIGNETSREEYIKELTNYFRSKRKYLTAEEKKRLTKNPLRLLDALMTSKREYFEDAPQILDWLDEESKNHFMGVLEVLDALEVPYVLNPFLVRGLDYYSHTVFEIWPTDKEGKSQSAIGSGGRYDGLAEILGGQETPACGFAFGTERLILALKEHEVKLKAKKMPEIFLAQIGQQGKVQAMKLFEKFRKEGVGAYENFSKDSLKAQLDQANKLGVKYTLIVGQKEVLDGTVLVRDMESGVQEIINSDKVTSEMRKKLGSK